MTATTQQQAPGCFGAASCYSMDSVVCQACVAFKECGDAAVERLQALRNIVDVRDLLNRHTAARQKAMQKIAPPAPAQPVETSPLPVAQPELVQKAIPRETTVAKVIFEIPPADQQVVDMLGTKNVKAREAALVLCKNNRVNDMRSQLPRGLNPFDKTGPQYLRIICDMLVRGGFTKAQYKARLVQELGWSDGTAASHVAVGCALLYSFGIMTLDSQGAFVLAPALSGDNQVTNS